LNKYLKIEYNYKKKKGGDRMNKEKELVLIKDLKEINEEIILELVNTELDETCHFDYIEDYTSKLSFYLSNVSRDDYVNYYLPYFLEYYNIECSKEVYVELQAKIIELIIDMCI
jgi:hypothetical protein